MDKLSNEAKIGLIVLISIIIAFFGFRIMKDEPFFSSSNTLYTKYDSVNGLLKGGNVFLIGFKVGTVQSLEYLPEEDSVLVTLNITEDITVPAGSKAKLVVPNFIGSSSIEIVKGKSSQILEWGSYIEGANEEGLLDGLTEKGGSMADSAAVTVGLANNVLRSIVNLQEKTSDNVSGSLSNLKESTDVLSSIIENRKVEVDSMIVDAKNTLSNLSQLSDSSSEDIESMIANLEEFSSKLDALSSELQMSSESINSILSKIDLGEGTLGKMVNDPSLYNNMDSLTVNLNELIKGIQEDPRRYLKHMRLVEIF
ncbi:MAG: MlaD family protein [Balneolaceae bacterium]